MKRILSLLLALALCGALVGCGGQGSSSSGSSDGSAASAPGVFMPPMFMADGVLYEDTGRESTVDGRCGNMDGEITSSVPSWQQPEEDGQSNFGSGFGYQVGPEPNTLELYQDGHWLVFQAVDGEN